MKNFKYLVFLIILTLFDINVYASNKIYSIDINVELDENGNGHITEVWETDLDNGTELYKPMGNLGESQISNFVVKMNNKKFEYISWNSNMFFYEKAYKNGFNYNNGILELCFGISKYGKNNYIISYDVSNMIYNLEDSDVLYWKFINDSMNPAPKSFTVTVKGPKDYNSDIEVYGFGYNGETVIHDGKISMQNFKDFKSNNYAILLAKYPKNTFQTNYNDSQFKNFNDVYNFLVKDSKTYNFFTKYIYLSVYIVLAFISIVVLLIKYLLDLLVAVLESRLKLSKINIFKKYEYKSDYNKKVIYFREIPNIDIFESYFLINSIKNNLNKSDLLGAILLKWIKEKKAKIITKNKRFLFFNININSIQIEKNLKFENNIENRFYDMIYSASCDGILGKNELKKWCKQFYMLLFELYDDLEFDYRNKLIMEDKISVTEKGMLFKKKIYTFNSELNCEVNKLLGLKKFLNNFTKIDERMPIEVHIWQEYLIYAQMFGIAKKVRKKFKKLYPNMNQMIDYDYKNILWIDSTMHVGYVTAVHSYNKKNYGLSRIGRGSSARGGGSGGGVR